jgi:hypothetical protein
MGRTPISIGSRLVAVGCYVIAAVGGQGPARELFGLGETAPQALQLVGEGLELVRSLHRRGGRLAQREELRELGDEPLEPERAGFHPRDQGLQRLREPIRDLDLLGHRVERLRELGPDIGIGRRGELPLEPLLLVLERGGVDVERDLPGGRGLPRQTSQAVERRARLPADRPAPLRDHPLRHRRHEVRERVDRALPAPQPLFLGRVTGHGEQLGARIVPGPAERRADDGLHAEDRGTHAHRGEDGESDRPGHATGESPEEVGPGIACLVADRHQRLAIRSSR